MMDTNDDDVFDWLFAAIARAAAAGDLSPNAVTLLSNPAPQLYAPMSRSDWEDCSCRWTGDRVDRDPTCPIHGDPQVL